MRKAVDIVARLVSVKRLVIQSRFKVEIMKLYSNTLNAGSFRLLRIPSLRLDLSYLYNFIKGLLV